ncbi:TRAP transporter large permease [Halotalea alkalilenta]|uniref:TRAP transporter large permease n=1 Tax=Halotalea alkalilenta TaxID=376489 RepID=UPI000489A07C|nr:TRAP transporter large permease [Halotalea alkalilenta]
MSAWWVVAALLALLAAGVPVAFAFALLAAVMLWWIDIPMISIPLGLIEGIDSFVLLSVPLFLLMSNVLLRGGMGRDLFAAVQSWVGHWPGGLGVATILSCALFSAICGSSVATAATIGNVAIGEMTSRGYPKRFVYGLLAAGGTLGVLIPPSIPLIIYGAITEESIVELFLAGIVPGLVLTGLFMLACLVHAFTRHGAPRLAPQSLKQRWRASRGALPALGLAVLIVGGIYTGAFTPTEAAGIGAVAAVLLVGLMGRLNWADLRQAVLDSFRTTVTLFLIIIGAKLFGHAVALYDIPQQITTQITATFTTPLGFLLVVALVVLVVGLFLESVSLLLLMVPILLPSLLGMGIDLVWFGILFVIMIEFALITPPVGMNLFVLQAVAGARMGEIVRGVVPFFALMVVALILVYLFPALALWLAKG